LPVAPRARCGSATYVNGFAAMFASGFGPQTRMVAGLAGDCYTYPMFLEHQ